MTNEERNAVIEQCAVVAEQTVDGSHEGNERARLIAETLRSMKMEG